MCARSSTATGPPERRHGDRGVLETRTRLRPAQRRHRLRPYEQRAVEDPRAARRGGERSVSLRRKGTRAAVTPSMQEPRGTRHEFMDQARFWSSHNYLYLCPPAHEASGLCSGCPNSQSTGPETRGRLQATVKGANANVAPFAQWEDRRPWPILLGRVEPCWGRSCGLVMARRKGRRAAPSPSRAEDLRRQMAPSGLHTADRVLLAAGVRHPPTPARE